MTFNELNTVEYYIIQNLSGVNLNSGTVDDSPDTNLWLYKSPDRINRDIKDTIIEEEVKKALILLNPEINKKPELADEVIYKLRSILISVNQVGLVRANEEFFEWLRGDKTMPFGENNQHIPIGYLPVGAEVETHIYATVTN